MVSNPGEERGSCQDRWTLDFFRGARAPIESSSHSSFRAASWRPSSSALIPARIALSFECDAEIDGSKSSRPAPSLRSKPCSAFEGAPHDAAAAAESSSWSRASCSASSSEVARRGASPAEEPGLEPAEPPAADAWLAEEPAWLGGAPEVASARSDMVAGDLRLLEEREPPPPRTLRQTRSEGGRDTVGWVGQTASRPRAKLLGRNAKSRRGRDGRAVKGEESAARAGMGAHRLGGAGEATGSFSSARLLRVLELRAHMMMSGWVSARRVFWSCHGAGARALGANGGGGWRD